MPAPIPDAIRHTDFSRNEYTNRLIAKIWKKRRLVDQQ